MKHFLFGLLSNLGLLLYLPAQDTDILLNHELYHYIDRLDIRGLSDTTIITDTKPYGRAMLSGIFQRTQESRLAPVERAWHTRMRILADDEFASQQVYSGIWKHFYTNGRDLFAHRQKDFEVYINPSAQLGLGLERHDFTNGESPQTLLNNARGVSIRGSIFGKIGFYTEVYDNVIRFPQFVFNAYRQERVLPGEAFIKRFGDQNGLNFFSSRAYLTFSPIRNIRIKLGKDRAFWGNGYQSLSLSDQATDYLFFTIQTRIWKFQYINHFAQMIDFIPNKNDSEGTFPRKYGVFHQLTLQPSPTWSFSIFESIIYTPILPNGRRGFEVQYLNPIIFYRGVEQSLGSPDNATIGFSAKVNLFQRFQLYGQVLLDDYNFSKRKEGSGFWGNKVGYQLGLKYIDVLGISTLDAQMEYNRLRPYTYQHFNSSASYMHYGQNLGHAAGANLEDINLVLRYQPFPAWSLYMSYTYLRQGLDMDGLNYGADPRRSYIVNRPRDFGNVVGQGLEREVHHLFGKVSYQLWNTDMFAELEARVRQEGDFSSASALIGIRMGLPTRLIKF